MVCPAVSSTPPGSAVTVTAAGAGFVGDVTDVEDVTAVVASELGPELGTVAVVDGRRPPVGVESLQALAARSTATDARADKDTGSLVMRLSLPYRGVRFRLATGRQTSLEAEVLTW